MTGGSETNPEDAPMRPPGPLDRPWTHPSEIGLATRGSVDRRRSSILATGVVLGGLGLLLSGMLLGSGDGDQRVSATSERTERIERSVLTVISVHDGTTSLHAGLAVDHAGHVLVPIDAVRDADSLWVQGAGGVSTRADAVTLDERTAFGVVRTHEPAGTPPRISEGPPTPGQEVLLVRCGKDGPTTRSGRIGSEVLVGKLPPAPWTHHVVATPVTTGGDGSSAGELVFDASGRLLGLSRDRRAEGAVVGDAPGASRVMHPARDLLELGRRLVADASD